MKMGAVIVLCVGLVVASCGTARYAGYHPTQKIPPQALQADLALLRDILQTKHPSLYWYTSPDSLNMAYQAVYHSITDSLTETAFRNKIASYVSQIRCGHTQVRSSRQYTKYMRGRRLPQFPLTLKVWDDTLVVVSNLLQSPLLPPGTLVTAINGRSNRQVLDSMYSLIGADGFTNSFKQQLLSFYFPGYYRLAYGIDSLYRIHIIDSTGRPQVIKISAFRPPPDSTVKAPPFADREKQPSRKERKQRQALSQRRLQVDTNASTAYLTINTFSKNGLRSFFKKSFKTIEQLGLQHLCVDLRQNSGGNIFNSTRLLQYLVDSSFRVADTVAAIDRSMKYRQHIKPWFLYWLSMHFTGRRRFEGRIHFRYFEKHRFKPIKKYHFDGNVYLLTSGYTFSAASMVANQLKGQHNVLLVGEETGGGAYGNSAVHLPEVTLPHSGLRVVLPLYRMVFNASKPKDGRGVLPDVQVRASAQSIQQGVDVKLQKVKQLIQAGNNVGPAN